MKAFWLIIGLALAIRLFAAFACNVIPDYSDMLEYNQIAMGMAVNPQHGFGYASFLQMIYGVFGNLNYLSVFLIQAILGTASVALIYYAALSVGTRRVALIAAFIAAIYPYFIAYGCTTLTETLAVFLSLSMVCVCLTPITNTVKAVSAAVILAYLVFIRPSCIFFLPGMLFMLKRKRLFLLVAIPLCALAIWQFGHSPSWAAAYNFYASYNENATGRYLKPEQLPVDYTEYTSSGLFKLGLHNALSNPHMAMKVIYNKIALIFAPGYDHHVIEPMIGTHKSLGWMLDLFYPLIAILGFIGMIRYPHILMAPFFAYLVRSVLIFCFEYRYRLIFEPIVIIYAAVMIDKIRRRDICAL